MKSRLLFFALFALIIMSCNEKSKNQAIDVIPKIVNIDINDASQNVIRLNLDKEYPNLLDPRNSTELEMDNVLRIWRAYHKDFSKYLKEKGFKWDVSDSMIMVGNKMYYDKNGVLEHHLFRVRNKNITFEKKQEYKKLLEEYSTIGKIDLLRDSQFAQCGTVAYQNY